MARMPPRGRPTRRPTQAGQHRCLLPSGDQPDDVPRPVEYGIGQGHPAPALIDAGDRDVGAGRVEHRIAGHQRRRVAVGPEAQVGEIEHCRGARNLLEHRGVLAARKFEVGRFHRHGVNLVGAQRTMREQALAQMGEVAVGISGRRHALVHLDHVHTGPWHPFLGQRPQHRPRGVTSAEGHDKAAARGDGRARLLGGECGARSRDRIGVGQHFDLHDALIIGFCQPPGGETLVSTSFGPQAPGSYS